MHFNRFIVKRIYHCHTRDFTNTATLFHIEAPSQYQTTAPDDLKDSSSHHNRSTASKCRYSGLIYIQKRKYTPTFLVIVSNLATGPRKSSTNSAGAVLWTLC